MAVTYKKPVDDDVPWEQRLANYAGNKDAGLSEYQRALEVYRGKSAEGDTAGADAAKKWSDQVNTAIGGIGNNRTAQVNNALDNVGQKVNATPFQFKQTAAPFQYNAQADPSYQAALRQAQAGAQTATNNAMVGLGSRGIGNSSVAVDRANQIQQKAIGNVNDTILPQLMQQAYSRYQDENNNEYRNQLANYQAGQDQIGNLTKYAGTLSDLGNQEFDRQRLMDLDAAKKRQEHIDLAKQLTDTYGVQVDPKDDPYYAYQQVKGLTPLSMREYNDRRADTKFDQDYKTKSLDSTISDRNADNARLSAAPSASTKTEQAKVEKEQAAQAKKMDDEKRGLISAVTDPQNPLQYSEAKKQIENDLRVGFYTKAEADELLATLEQWAQSAYATRYQ